MSYRYGYVIDDDYWVPKEKVAYYRNRQLRPAVLTLLPPEHVRLYDELPDGYIGAPPRQQLPDGNALREAPLRLQLPDGSAHRFFGAPPLLQLPEGNAPRPRGYNSQIPLHMARRERPAAVDPFPVNLGYPLVPPGFAPLYPHGPQEAHPRAHLYPEQQRVAQVFVPPPPAPVQEENINFEDDNFAEQHEAANAEIEDDNDADDEMDEVEMEDPEEDPEEDPDEDPEEDPEEGPEEDPEEGPQGDEEEEPEQQDMAQDGDSTITSSSEYTPSTPSDRDP